MPGMDIRAPERQETNNGLTGSPNFIPIAFSVLRKAVSNSAFNSLGNLPPNLKYSTQAAVVIVKPAGTGKPIKHISARLAPLPPNNSFIFPSPSATLPPKKYTLFTITLTPFLIVFGIFTRNFTPKEFKFYNGISLSSNQLRFSSLIFNVYFQKKWVYL